MMAKDPNITADYFRQSGLYYDPETGVFTRHRKVTAQRSSNGYIRINVAGQRVRAHRLAWFYCYGRWPASEIDHINQIKTDNRIANLRETTPWENQTNKDWLVGRNRHGFMGVETRRGRYHARTVVAGRTKTSRSFATPEEAHAEYLRLVERYHGQATVDKPAAYCRI